MTLQDKILEIITEVDKNNANKHYLPPDKRYKIMSKLLSDHIKEFIEWFTFQDEFQIYDNPGVFIRLSDYKLYDTDWIYTYWLTQIKGK